MASALITGVAGQDGSYLAELLLKKGYEVHGVCRPHSSLPASLAAVHLHEGDAGDETLIRALADRSFTEIYNLASVSTVASPWEDPAATITSTGMIPLRYLEAIRAQSPSTKFFQASSAEMYGDPLESPQTEATPFAPRNPYGFGKLLAHEAVEGYRTQFKLFAVSGILFNHESPRRPPRFVTRKITSTLARIVRGSDETLELGNLDAVRDWSFAGDIAEGMWRSLQHPTPDTYVFASGETHTVREFVEAAARALSLPLRFEGHGIDERGYHAATGALVVAVNPVFFRPLEARPRQGDPSKLRSVLQWRPATSFEELVQIMVRAEGSD
ncbi:GDP-mannose 4,6-dehydratase [Patescibacteria group bacterium]|nr:GDP-mannose 4,6-dehydratase [Patescibacteria group bacterium]